jgi:5'-nucleotidase
LAEILLTNDDGILSPGIQVLASALSAIGRVTVVAPDRERSASSASLTLHLPLRYEEIGPNRFSVEGTPTDCVIIGLHQILSALPDLVVSGINKGPNLGHDIAYSGTVSAASEGANQGIPSFAISLASFAESHYEEAAQFGAALARRILDESLPPGVILNVNVPSQAIRGVRITHQGQRNFRNIFVENMDPRGRKYFWLDQEMETESHQGSVSSDYRAISAGFVSITPLKIDRTDYSFAKRMETWPDSLSKEIIISH